MPVTRCPACNVPLTHDEAQGAMCPACGAALAGLAAAEESRRDERLPALLCGGLGLLAEPLQQRAGVPKGVIDGLVLTTLALCALIWLLSPFYIRFATRRRVHELLNPTLDERLRALVGVRGWGWRHY